MDAVLYTRVSKDQQQRGKSVGQQEDEARLACAALGWEIAAVFSDNDRSASRYARREREGYQQLLAYLAENTVGVLVLWETSRGSRELENWAGLLNLCRARGIRIHVVDDQRTYSLDVPNDWKSLATAGVDSAHESDKLRQRILRDVRANASAGRPHGKLAFGFTRVYDERGNFVAQPEQPEQGALLREMARRVLAGESLYKIAADFNARGLASPGRKPSGWEPGEIKRLLVNPAYAGKRVLRGQVVGDAVWPALFTETEHHRLVALLTDPSRRTVTDSTVRHLLSGLITCDECGSTRVNPLSRRGCPAYTCRTGFCIAIRTTTLEQLITDLVIRRLSRPDAAEIFAGPGRDEGGVSAAKEELAALKARLEGFAVEGALGRISPGTLARVEAELTPLIADAERRAAPRPPTSPVLRRLTAPGVNVPAAWERLDIMARRGVIQTLMDLRVGKTYRGARSLDPARLDQSRWKGDPLTWGEHRKAAQPG